MAINSAPLPQTAAYTCPHCGAALELLAKECPRCGAQLDSTTLTQSGRSFGRSVLLSLGVFFFGILTLYGAVVSAIYFQKFGAATPLLGVSVAVTLAAGAAFLRCLRPFYKSRN